MLNLLLLALAAHGPATVTVSSAVPVDMMGTHPFIREPRVAGPTAVEFRTLSQPHPNSDDRTFPDIAISALRIDGDTLYVQLTNKGRSGTQSSTLIAARAVSAGMKSDRAEVRTGRFAPGETRWVPIRGFSVKTASNGGSVFSLASASVVSAAARILPSTAGTLDRSGEGCGECTEEMDETNNVLTLSGDAIKRGPPQ